MSDDVTNDVISQLGFEKEISLLRERISAWIERSDEDVRDALRWQFLGNSKYFRPLTAFSCYRAIQDGPIPERLIASGLVVEMFHNVSLIIDDIVDESPERRGKATLHQRFGSLEALMVAGYIVADGYQTIHNDPYSIQLFSELMKRLGAAECKQWKERRQPRGVQGWRVLAREDTGSMFEMCACVGTSAVRAKRQKRPGNEVLRIFGQKLGMLYHGCDDVGDVRGAEALGGGGDEDIRAGILTLPAAIATRDNSMIKDLFEKPEHTDEDIERLTQAFVAKLPEAEQHLDKIADEARLETNLAKNPEPLLALVDHTRQLSMR